MAQAFLHGSGFDPLNFKVVGGTAAPSNPRENTIWVNTNTAIESWHLGAEEPNVWEVTMVNEYPWLMSVPFKLSEGDVLNFTILRTATSMFEAIRIRDITNRVYFVRIGDGSALTASTGWHAGTKVGVVISDASYPVGDWGSGGGSAIIHTWGSFYHGAGTVWIITGAASSAAFNALKRNDLRVYPVSATQYVNGAWQEVTAKIFQGGFWRDWEFFVLLNGVFNSTYLFQVHNGDGEIASGDNAAIFKIHNNGYLTLYAVTKLDVSKKNAIEIAVTKGLSAYNVRFGLVSTKTSIDEQHENIFNVASVTFTPTSNSITPGRKTIDVSALTGEYWLGCTIEGSGGLDDSVYGKGGVSVEDIIIR